LSQSARFSGRARREIAAALEVMEHTAARRRLRQVIETVARRSHEGAGWRLSFRVGLN